VDSDDEPFFSRARRRIWPRCGYALKPRPASPSSVRHCLKTSGQYSPDGATRLVVTAQRIPTTSPNGLNGTRIYENTAAENDEGDPELVENVHYLCLNRAGFTRSSRPPSHSWAESAGATALRTKWRLSRGHSRGRTAREPPHITTVQNYMIDETKWSSAGRSLMLSTGPLSDTMPDVHRAIPNHRDILRNVALTAFTGT
jgi:hypothetical protein